MFERTHESRLFCVLYMCAREALLTGIVTTSTGKACNECKTLGQMGLLCSDTNVVFQTAIFLILVVKNNIRSSGIDSKTSDSPYQNLFILPLP